MILSLGSPHVCLPPLPRTSFSEHLCVQQPDSRECGKTPPTPKDVPVPRPQTTSQLSHPPSFLDHPPSPCAPLTLPPPTLQDIATVYQIFPDEVLGSGQFGVVYGGKDVSRADLERRLGGFWAPDLKNYLFIWLPWVMAHRIFDLHCGMWDLVP